MSEILDSGARREFSSGAVRDVAEGKGRCDLLPLDVVATIMGAYLSTDPICYPEDEVIYYIGQYVRKGDLSFLYTAIRRFIDREGMHPCTAMLELAKHYEEGLNKYPERNWEKGISLKCYIDSGVRHYLKHMRGDEDEPHNRAFLWNICGAIWTHMNRPQCIDLPFKDNPKESVPTSESDKMDDSDFQARAERMTQRMQKYRETSFA